MTNAATLINQTSHDVEWFTQPNIIKAATAVLGGIDLDPASCAVANETVRARRYFTATDNGLVRPWYAHSVFLNHPFGEEEYPCKPVCTKKRCEKRGHCVDTYQPGSKDWIAKLIGEYRLGNFQCACTILYASTSEGWFQPLYDFPICFRNERDKYRRPDGTVGASPSKGSVIVYLGEDVQRFHDAFKALGNVMVPHQ